MFYFFSISWRVNAPQKSIVGRIVRVAVLHECIKRWFPPRRIAFIAGIVKTFARSAQRRIKVYKTLTWTRWKYIYTRRYESKRVYTPRAENTLYEITNS